MPPAADMFGVGVLVLALGALGLSVVFEASRLSAVTGKQAILRRRRQARERELFDLQRRVETADAEAQAKQTTLDNLTTEKTRIAAVIASIQSSKIEMVHEIGEPEGSATLYQGDLRPTSDFGRPGQRGVFAREIWERPNVAHVWADTPEAAMAAIQRAFNARTGIQSTRVMRAEMVQVQPAQDAVADLAGRGKETRAA